MGGGCWSNKSYASYTCSIGRSYDEGTGTFIDTYATTGEAFARGRIDESMSPRGVLRECCDSAEHPESFPIIFALDVTGSMGRTAIEIQKKLNPIMTDILSDKAVKDPELMVMAIGDVECDRAPIQISQFESDVRIAESLDKIYFEGGGGANDCESYTAAWYMGLKHCSLDCWKRGRKGLIITLGDEPLNPDLDPDMLSQATGDQVAASELGTDALYRKVVEKYDVVHICIESRSYPDQRANMKAFAKVIGDENVFVSDVDGLQNMVAGIIRRYAAKNAGRGAPIGSLLGEGSSGGLPVIGW